MSANDWYREEVLRRIGLENARLRKLGGERPPISDDDRYRERLLWMAESETAHAEIDRLSEKHLRPLLKAAIDYVNRAEDRLYAHRAARITLLPTTLNFDVHEEVFEILRADLAALGHDAVVEPVQEGRGAGVDPETLAWFPVYVWIAGEAGRIGRRVIDQLVSEITTSVIARFRDRSIDRVVIYGPQNEILAEVDLEAERRTGAA
jgi:hypothetical protein